MNELVRLAKQVLQRKRATQLPWLDPVQVHGSDPGNSGDPIPGNVPLCLNPGRLETGVWLEFNSPIFGPCIGLVVLVDGYRLLVDRHSVLKTSTWIYARWVSKVLPGPPGDSPNETIGHFGLAAEDCP